MNDAAPTQPPESLADLLSQWIETETWGESRAMLESNRERLLSDDALAILNTRIAESAGHSDTENDETVILERHRVILETARAESIDAAYAFMLEPSQLAAAIEAMLQANNSTELLEQVKQHPLLLTQEGLEAIARYIEQLRQENHNESSDALQERLESLVKAIESAASSDDATSDDLIKLLLQWMSTDTWSESRDLLTTNTERLLSDDALSALDVLLMTSTDNEAVTKTLRQHHDILEAARAESIDAAYAFMSQPSSLTNELSRAVEAMAQANSRTELLKQAQQHPVLLTQEGIAAIDRYIAKLEQENQTDLAEGLRERLKALVKATENADSSEDTTSNDLTKLLLQWVGTGTWNESREILAASAERLLSDDAITALDALLTMSPDNEEATKLLLQHRNILEVARTQSIDVAYADLLILLPLQEAFAALYRADTLRQLQLTIDQHPVLLDEDALQILSRRVDEIEQNGNAALATLLRLRIGEVRHIRQQRELVQNEVVSLQPFEDEPGQVTTYATGNSIAINRNYGSDITQTNINMVNYSQPDMKWLHPKRQAFRDRKTFIGRDKLVETLLHYLAGGENVAITGVMKAATLRGMGGIGKTYLARKLAVELQDKFPGGCIWLKLGPSVRSRADVQDPLSQLVKFAFNGHTPIPPSGKFDPDTVAAWLGAMAPGRMLVVFDDVWHEEPLRLLNDALPAEAVRLATTRSVKVATILGGHTETLGRLSTEDGLALLEDRLNCPHDTPYQGVLTQLVTLLAGHALALDIAAALIEKPIHIEMILRKLKDGIGQGELERLRIRQNGGEEEERDTNLEKSLALSYEMMNAEQRYRFRTLGIFAPETPITPEAVAAIWNIEAPESAQEALDELDNLALLTEDADTLTPVYRLHGLLHVYAHALLEKADELTGASWAHARYYTTLVWQVEQTTPRDYPLLDQHIQNLLAALKWTVDNEPDLFTELLDGLKQFFLLRGLSELLEKYLPAAIEVASTLGRKGRQANLLQSLGDLERRLGHIDQARTHYDAALPLFQAERDQLGQANLLKSLGDLERRLGHIDQARTHYDAALPLFQAERSQLGQANLLKSLGDLENRLGHIDQARTHYDAALPLYRAERARLGEAGVYMSLGDMFIAQREWVRARAYYEQALPLFIIERDLLGQANTLIDLGRARFEMGDRDQGLQDMHQAAALFHANRQEEWVQQANLRSIEMGVRMTLPGTNVNSLTPDKELLRSFIATESEQDVLELVKQHPQLLLASWSTLVETQLDAQGNEATQQRLNERIKMLEELRDAVVQQSAAARVLIDFARANWETRQQTLTEQAIILLNEHIEPLINLLAQTYTGPDPAIVRFWESIRTLLRRCHTWGSDTIFYFERYMRLGDTIDIPAAYEDRVMEIATLLSHQEKDGLEQAIKMMQMLLDQLTAGTPELFEAALLHELAQAMYVLPKNHPARKTGLIIDYSQEALPRYQAADRPLPVAFLQRLLGDVLNEQGRYEDALEPLQITLQILQIQKEYESLLVRTLLSYASTLDKLARTEEALQAYGQAIELLPDTPSLLRDRAETLIHAHRLDDAEADLRHAIELDGNEESPYLWVRRAQLAVARGDGALAEQMLDEMLKRSSFSSPFIRAQAAWLRGDMNVAQEALQTAFDAANKGDRAVMSREMQQLFAEHPDLPALNLPD